MIALAIIKSRIEHRRKFKSQSAMEYLMTYGWAILIIAVVLASFYELGVFNPYTFAAKAQPGSCSVYRPDGAGTNNFISLLGPCTNEIPQYAAQFTPLSSTYPMIYASSPLIPSGLNSRTVTLWFYVKSPATIFTFDNGSSSACLPFAIEIRPGDSFFLSTCNDDFYTGLNATYDRWYFVAVTETVISSSRIINVTLDTQTATQTSTDLNNGNADQINIGGWDGSHTYQMNGSIANVQIYNTALSQPDIQALYKEGIGGVPIDLNNLVGWWPLNGNANDYSGNGNNGNAINVSFTGGWYKGYTAP
ncbi:MAG: LamG domain-containing protein [Candidatus Marsarchaeota archaeon]|nr:LamG domain-containing protein [Candidatus Marsarchaeota archaeon]